MATKMFLANCIRIMGFYDLSENAAQKYQDFISNAVAVLMLPEEPLKNSYLQKTPYR
jgi:hypothetical protein